MIRYFLRFTGRVQGVGFRWKTKQEAEMLHLTGWVKNMSDGSVEMEVQGLESSIDALLISLTSNRYIRIDGVHKEKREVIPNERDFGVTY